MRTFKVFISFIFLLLSCVIFLSLSLARSYYLQLTATRLDPLGLQSPAFQSRMDSPEQPIIMFLGDSRAQQWPIPTDLASRHFVNFGISAHTSAQVSARLSVHLESINPNIVILQMCINDLKAIAVFEHRQKEIVNNCKRNIEKVIALSKEQNIQIVLTTIFPLGDIPLWRKISWSQLTNQAIRDINDFILDNADPNVVVFDAFGLLSNHEGKLKAEYSKDYIHLNQHGYSELNKKLRTLLLAL